MKAFEEIISTIELIVNRKMERTAQIYFCIVETVNTNNKTCEVFTNGVVYTVSYYGTTPSVNQRYPLFVPQGNMATAFVIG